MISSLLYADDLVLMADNTEKLLTLLQNVEKWYKRNFNN